VPLGDSRRAALGRSRGAPTGVLLTSATGFLGMELLARYVERTDRRIFALVRAPTEREAKARIERTLRCLFGAAHPHGERVVAVRGDITSSGASHAPRATSRSSRRCRWD
jgi:nucleoside-diphosphate-sugar epimerase